MFDAHLLYFAYNNIEGDEFGVGMIGNKEDWVRRINRWAVEDGNVGAFTVEDWDDLDFQNDFRGVELAEVEPVDVGWLVTWLNDRGDENVVEITHKFAISWKINPNKSDSIPQWLKRLKNTLRDGKIE